MGGKISVAKAKLERALVVGTGSPKVSDWIKIEYVSISSKPGWNIWNRSNTSDNPMCNCGQYSILCQILSASPVGLIKRYTWRYSKILKVFFISLVNKFGHFNQGKIPARQATKKKTVPQ